MKLLFSISYYFPYSSGLSIYVKRLAEKLVEKNFQCTVITNRHLDGLPREEKINRVKVVRANPLFKISKGFFSFEFAAKSFIEVLHSDVILINLPQFEGFIPAIWGKISGKKIIAIYHCEVILPPGIGNFFVEKGLNLANYLTLLLADSIITYTRDFAENSKLLPAFKSKLHTVYPPIIKPEIDKRVQNILREKTGKTSGFIIGVAARLAAEKGVEYLFEAIPILEEKLKNQTFKIVIAGSLDPVGEENYKNIILKLVEKYKDRIIFLGELKENEMGSFYSLLDVLVLSSVNSTEAFGMVQVEAMMLGVPVVSTDLPGVRIPIQMTGMGKTVGIKNPNGLALAIADIIDNKDKYVKNRNKAEKEFAIGKTVLFYEKLINNLT